MALSKLVNKLCMPDLTNQRPFSAWSGLLHTACGQSTPLPVAVKFQLISSCGASYCHDCAWKVCGVNCVTQRNKTLKRFTYMKSKIPVIKSRCSRQRFSHPWTGKYVGILSFMLSIWLFTYHKHVSLSISCSFIHHCVTCVCVVYTIRSNSTSDHTLALPVQRCMTSHRLTLRGVARLFQNEGAARGAEGWVGGGWPWLKMAALHRPLYKV